MNKTSLAETITKIEPYESLDSTDSLKDFSKRFYHPITDSGNPFIYLSGNSLGLQPNTAEKYVFNEIKKTLKKLGI